jgi:hypothetical protein
MISRTTHKPTARKKAKKRNRAVTKNTSELHVLGPTQFHSEGGGLASTTKTKSAVLSCHPQAVDWSELLFPLPFNYFSSMLLSRITISYYYFRRLRLEKLAVTPKKILKTLFCKEFLSAA